MDNSDVWRLSNSTVYVRGALRGAIYDFNTGKVYSINEDACSILNLYISNINTKHSFITNLTTNGLIDTSFIPCSYKFVPITNEINFVWLELTNNCNLRCIHCYDGDCHKSSTDSLNFDEWKNILLQLKSMNCKTVEFIGGEPGTFPKFYELMVYTKYLGIKMEVYSNLTILNADVVKFICDNKIPVHFSIYGSKPEKHDTITGVKGSFEKTMAMVKTFIHNDVKVIPTATFMKKNQDEINSLQELMKSMNLRLKIDVVRPSKFRKIDSLLPDKFVTSNVTRTQANFKTNKYYFDRASKINTCLFGKFSITSEGNVIPCEFSREYVIGNIRKNPIIDILKKEEMQNFWYMNFSKIEECKLCEYRFACKDCRFLSEKLDQKNPRCLYNPLNGIWNCDKR